MSLKLILLDKRPKRDLMKAKLVSIDYTPKLNTSQTNFINTKKMMNSILNKQEKSPSNNPLTKTKASFK